MKVEDNNTYNAIWYSHKKQNLCYNFVLLISYISDVNSFFAEVYIDHDTFVCSDK